jgi:hypothetical protein
MQITSGLVYLPIKKAIININQTGVQLNFLNSGIYVIHCIGCIAILLLGFRKFVFD